MISLIEVKNMYNLIQGVSIYGESKRKMFENEKKSLEN